MQCLLRDLGNEIAMDCSFRIEKRGTSAHFENSLEFEEMQLKTVNIEPATRFRRNRRFGENLMNLMKSEGFRRIRRRTADLKKSEGFRRIWKSRSPVRDFEEISKPGGRRHDILSEPRISEKSEAML